MKRKRVIDYLLDLFTVVFGVFLGMLASDWNASRNQEKTQRAFLMSIKTELAQNLALLDASEQRRMPFYHSMDSLDKLLTHKQLAEPFYDKPFRERLPNWPGLGYSRVSNAMFKAAQSSNILPSLDIKLLEQLSKTYNTQDNMHDIRRVLGDRFFNLPPAITYKKVWDYMWRVREELWGTQHFLSKDYRKTIEMINDHLKE